MRRFHGDLLKGIPLLLTLILSGCIEHQYFYKFDRDSVCDFTYNARGDSLDIYDPPGSFPDSLLYQVKTWIEVDTAGRETYVLEAKRKFTGGELPRTLGLKEVPDIEILLHHPGSLKKTDLFFLTIYQFESVFIGRQRTLTEGDQWKFIPEECRILESDEDSTLSEEERTQLEEKYAAGMLIWSAERYKLRVREILNRCLENHPDKTVPQSWIGSALVEADSMIESFASSMDIKNLNFADLEWWDELAPKTNAILLGNLNILGDSALQSEILNVGELLEMKHQVTEDLMDESFKVMAELPGKLVSSDAEISPEGYLLWKFNGEDITDDDRIMKATSILWFPERLIGALVLLIVIFLGVRMKRPKEESGKSESSPYQDSIPPIGHG